MSEEKNKSPELSSPVVPEGDDALADRVSDTIAVASDQAAAESPAADVAGEAVLEEERVKDERVLEPLIGQLRNDEFNELATEALAEIGQPAVEKLVAALKDKDENVRKQAVIALGRIKDPTACDALIEMLKDKDWFTRLTAAAALEQLHDERGREAIKPLLQDPDLVVRMRVERILAAWKKGAATA